MAKAIYITDFPPENTLPPMDSDTGLQLHELVSGQIRAGSGFSCVGHVPQAPTCIVLVDSSQATIDGMKASAKYLWIEDL
jgi:hypothetical protein